MKVGVEAEEPAANQTQETSLSLQEILRNQKRARQRQKESHRRVNAPPPPTAVVPAETPSPDLYAGRFTKQTGHVVDKDDKQMYVSTG